MQAQFRAYSSQVTDLLYLTRRSVQSETVRNNSREQLPEDILKSLRAVHLKRRFVRDPQPVRYRYSQTDHVSTFPSPQLQLEVVAQSRKPCGLRVRLGQRMDGCQVDGFLQLPSLLLSYTLTEPSLSLSLSFAHWCGCILLFFYPPVHLLPIAPKCNQHAPTNNPFSSSLYYPFRPEDSSSPVITSTHSTETP